MCRLAWKRPRRRNKPRVRGGLHRQSGTEARHKQSGSRAPAIGRWSEGEAQCRTQRRKDTALRLPADILDGGEKTRGQSFMECSVSDRGGRLGIGKDVVAAVAGEECCGARLRRGRDVGSLVSLLLGAADGSWQVVAKRAGRINPRHFKTLLGQSKRQVAAQGPGIRALVSHRIVREHCDACGGNAWRGKAGRDDGRIQPARYTNQGTRIERSPCRYAVLNSLPQSVGGDGNAPSRNRRGEGPWRPFCGKRRAIAFEPESKTRKQFADTVQYGFRSWQAIPIQKTSECRPVDRGTCIVACEEQIDVRGHEGGARRTPEITWKCAGRVAHHA
ncbi:hypothetical protein BV97_03125 [Novosphingobium resinovorum]|uniref:Uncharacterized protein n=1 Tax=Novosphingobium resinovorum TaxID=158500 RepID=A0A031JWG3_9SPHN|nr:hypothetical protein BV97_03125 [Novosphingobium resinovorum]